LIEIEADPELHPPAHAALQAVGIEEGHVAITLVDSDRIHELNREHRAIDRPTDVLSFPVDGTGPVAGPRELGDVVICPEHTEDIPEAVVHGVLHLCGYDHETDDGEMLALQDRIVATL
jgi:probable rRNA maturation factor